MRFPKPLFPGARVALIAPAGPVPEQRLQPAVQAVQNLGLRPVVYESCQSAHGYLAGDDAIRASDLASAFADPDTDGIFCIRGGYGAQRILPLVNWEEIAACPKFFCGYSDVTALHIVLGQRCGLSTFHTPMPSTELYKGVDPYTMGWLKKACFGGLWGWLQNPPDRPLRALSPGRARGELTGGNLSLVASSLGTPYEIDTRGKILFLEEVDERPYRIDGMLTHLRNAGKLRDCAGILLGAFTSCAATLPDRSLTLLQILDEVLPKNIPVVGNFCCGHTLPTLSLPLGAQAVLDADARTLWVEAPA